MGRVVIGNINGVADLISDEEFNQALEEYLLVNPIGNNEPLLNVHVVDTTPHPAYDDTQSLVGLLENGLI